MDSAAGTFAVPQLVWKVSVKAGSPEPSSVAVNEPAGQDAGITSRVLTMVCVLRSFALRLKTSPGDAP